MKRAFTLILICFLALSFGACTSAQKKRDKAIAVGVYKVSKAIDSGRIDEAKRYSRELTRIVAPPKEKIVVKPIEVKKEGVSQTLVILPEELKDKTVIVENSQEFNKVLEQSKELQKQVAAEKKEFNKFQDKVDDSIRTTQAELAKEKKKSFWGWATGLVGGLGFVGIILLMVFFPAAIPLIINVVSSVFGVFNKLLAYVAGLFKRKNSDSG